METEGTTTETTPEATEEAAPQVDFSPVMDRLEEIGGRLGNLEPLLAQNGAESPEPEELPSLEDFLAQYEQEPAGGAFEPTADPQALEEYLSRRDQQNREQWEREAEEKYGAPLQHIQQHLQNQSIDQLEEEYPALQDPAVAKEVAAETKALAQRFGVDPSADLVELVVLARAGRRAAEQEAPAGDPEVQLEHPSAARQQEQQEDPALRILKASGGGGPWGR